LTCCSGPFYPNIETGDAFVTKKSKKNEKEANADFPSWGSPQGLSPFNQAVVSLSTFLPGLSYENNSDSSFQAQNGKTQGAR